MIDLHFYERKYWLRGITRIAGLDEAGRGPLAGPVVAAAVIFQPDVFIPFVNDSKKLTEKRREELYHLIHGRGIAIGVGIVGHDVIDRINILQASMLAMNKAIDQLKIQPEQLLVDGNFFRHEKFPAHFSCACFGWTYLYDRRMSIPITSPVKEGRRMATLFGSQFDRSDGDAATDEYYGEVVNARISYHRGVLVHTAGNAFLAVFDDAPDAVNCAIDIQERFGQYNKLHLDEGLIEAKIGIHFGEMLFSDGKLNGAGVDTITALLSIVPATKIYITREVFARVRMLLQLQLENIGSKKLGSLPAPKDILSVSWEAVTGNLQASLKKLREDDLQRATSLSSKLGFNASKRAIPIVVFLLLIFLLILSKILKWL